MKNKVHTVGISSIALGHCSHNIYEVRILRVLAFDMLEIKALAYKCIP